MQMPFVRTLAASIGDKSAANGVGDVDKAHAGVGSHAHVGGGHCDVEGLSEATAFLSNLRGQVQLRN